MNKVLEKAQYCLNCPKPACVVGCPAGVEINKFIQQIVQGDLQAARAIIEEKDNLGIICGAVCPHEKQCQGACVRGIKGTPVAIGFLEAAVCELANFKTKKLGKNLKVAIIGSGPSGLSCAKELAKNGIKATIFEKDENFGGILRYGIPDFRLPKDKIDKLISEIDAEFNANCEIKSLDELSDFDFIYVAAGANVSNKTGLENEILATEFLADYNRGKKIDLGRKVAVIGGGNVAMDAARGAARLGCQVEILYRRSEKEMPACREEIEAAKNEGIAIVELVSPISFEDGKLKIIHNCLGEIDESGRAKFVQIENSEEYCEFDSVIAAIGQHSENRFDVDNKRVFAGGDYVRGPATIVLAMKDGKEIAQKIINSKKVGK